MGVNLLRAAASRTRLGFSLSVQYVAVIPSESVGNCEADKLNWVYRRMDDSVFFGSAKLSFLLE